MVYRGRDWDEDDVRIRPPKKSRPRTKIRPKHKNARTAFVVGVDRGRYRCLLDDVPITAMKARELGRQSVVVGDRVDVVGDLSGKKDTLARIVRVKDRHGVLRRSADDDSSHERVAVANVDQLVMVASVTDPPFSSGFVDRCLVAAMEARISPILCCTKIDLDDGQFDSIRSYFTGTDLTIVAVSPDSDLAQFRELLADKENVFFGHSGVGKSTLVNRLIPDADRTVGDVRAIGKGSHTSTSAVAFELPGGGWVVDTPGVRSFGLAHVTVDSLLDAFPELAEAAQECPKGCTHTEGRDDCVLNEIFNDDDPRRARLESFRRMIQSLHDSRRDYER
ncbi:ribosome small subunit-dependent GTPase A [Haloglycomyces albus]|uniref:ribosome small subunit-dependent GTPase A n=1 Tax=Haloglycomyces albus TaxID=526067 RepID=UPI00046CF31B|nr:ribosome small subunit-dependent GTPase A [Haloglycomyces albus]